MEKGEGLGTRLHPMHLHSCVHSHTYECTVCTYCTHAHMYVVPLPTPHYVATRDVSDQAFLPAYFSMRACAGGRPWNEA